MSNTDFEISKDGIKVPYLRFLSDGAIGYVVILCALTLYKLGVGLPIYGLEWVTLTNYDLNQETRIFVLLLLFILASPVGLAINAASWFFLGIFQEGICITLFVLPTYLSFLLGTTKRNFHFDEMVSSYFSNIGTPLWNKRYQAYKIASLFAENIEVYLPQVYSKYDHVKGISRFTRNTSFLLFYLSIYYKDFSIFLGAVGCLALTGLIQAFENLSILFNVGSSTN